MYSPSKIQGLGAECASIGEVLNCLDAEFPGDKIVFDSPMKTAPEISKTMVYSLPNETC